MELLLETQKRAIEILKELVAGFENGDYTELNIAVATAPDGRYRIVGGTVEDRHTSAGILFEAALERLSVKWRD